MERNEIDFTATALATTADSIRGNRAAVDAFWTLASGSKIALNRLFYGIPICCVGFAVVCRNEVALFNSQLDRLVTFGDLDIPSCTSAHRLQGGFKKSERAGCDL